MAATPTDSERMTVAGLLDGSLMSGARAWSRAPTASVELSWVLPLSEVLTQHDPLDAVASMLRAARVMVGNGAATVGAHRRAAPRPCWWTARSRPISGHPPGSSSSGFGIPVRFAALVAARRTTRSARSPRHALLDACTRVAHGPVPPQRRAGDPGARGGYNLARNPARRLRSTLPAGVVACARHPRCARRWLIRWPCSRPICPPPSGGPTGTTPGSSR